MPAVVAENGALLTDIIEKLLTVYLKLYKPKL